MFVLAAIQALSLLVPTVHAGAPIDGSLQHEAWKNAKTVTLNWDLQGHKPAPQQTTVYIESDGKSLYVAFDARQRETLVATQHTNDVGQGSDDDVEIDLRPGGPNGFLYQFIANPLGTHYQFSSENTGYRPEWSSAGSVRNDGYVVTMRIPLAAIHGANARTWMLQFARRVETTGDLDVWSYDPNETRPTDAIYEGTMTGLRTARAVPRPRMEIYGLGLAGGKSIGGSTSRSGVDVSVPFTPTSSFYATVHPDYSNVELDQQSISPTAFRRVYTEVRPFFTQGNAAYGNFDFNISNGITALYTPAIPTPRYGYALEGKEGSFTYGAFNAVGDARTDSAQALTWRNAHRTLGFSVQRVVVDQPGYADDTFEIGSSFNDGKHLTGYFNYGIDKGTNVPDGRQAQYYDFGSAYSAPATAFGFAIRKEGAYFNPADGFVWHPDTAGYGAYFVHAWLFHKDSAFRSIMFRSEIARYHDSIGELDDTLEGAVLDVLTHGNIDVKLQSGSAYVRFSPKGTFYPTSQSGVSVTFGSGADSSNLNNNGYGSSATPTTLGFSTGRFGPGRLNAWTFSSTLKAMQRGLLTFELDGNLQKLDAGSRNDEWLERLSYTYQAGADASLALGVRRIIGAPPVLGGLPEPHRGWNLSAAYHRAFGAGNELYAVYGDAGAFASVPQFIVKWIHYFGGGKGT